MGNLFSKKDQEERKKLADQVAFLTKSMLDLTAAMQVNKENSEKNLEDHKKDSDAKIKQSQDEIKELKEQFQKSEEANQILVKENKDFKVKIEQQQNHLNQSHQSLRESLSSFVELERNLISSKEKYIKSSNDQILIVTAIVGNLQSQKHNTQSRLDESKSQLRNLNPIEKFTKSKILEDNIVKLSSECKKIFEDEERYNNEIKNIESNKTIFIKEVDNQIKTCKEQQARIKNEMAEIFNDKPRRASSILEEYDRNNSAFLSVK